MFFVGMLAMLMPPAAPISPADSRIVYVGRFDRRQPAAPSCQWSASEVRLNVKGKSLIVRMEEHGHDSWQLAVDGTASSVITPTEGTDSYTVALGADAIHDVRLVKRTEAFVGTTTFRGFEVPGGKLLKAKPGTRRIEFVGDSITCAFGNEGANQDEHFTPATENAYMSYASITGRQLNADVTILAWSGRKMWPDNTMPEIYDKILPATAGGPDFDFKQPAPSAVVIHLATNDFGKENPDEKQWTAAYEAFVKRVWAHYPKAQIYAAMGVMMSDNYPPGHNALTTLRGYLQRMATRINDRRFHLIEFETQKMEDGIGADWHPNIKTDNKMAAVLTAALRKDLGWP